ncbi:MAG: TerB family tellurite resistance protein [Panacagrimonas sp.]
MSWKHWLSRLDKPQGEPHPPRDIAIAVLLLECARADFDKQPAEIGAVRSALRAQFGLDDGEVERLMGEATQSASASVSLYGPVARLNDELTQDEKRALMQWLWRVAAVDGRVDPNEEALLRKVADLLYVSHADYIRAKLGAIQDKGV